MGFPFHGGNPTHGWKLKKTWTIMGNPKITPQKMSWGFHHDHHDFGILWKPPFWRMILATMARSPHGPLALAPGVFNAQLCRSWATSALHPGQMFGHGFITDYPWCNMNWYPLRFVVIMVYHGCSWFIMVYHGLSWSVHWWFGIIKTYKNILLRRASKYTLSFFVWKQKSSRITGFLPVPDYTWSARAQRRNQQGWNRCHYVPVELYTFPIC
jgi:hypothetical protein